MEGGETGLWEKFKAQAVRCGRRKIIKYLRKRRIVDL